MISRKTLDRIGQVTTLQLTIEDKRDLLTSTVEELGEYARALAVESGSKTGVSLDESARMEAIDLILCGMSLYFAEGGSVEDFDVNLDKKLTKWENMIERTIVEKHKNHNNWLKQAWFHHLVDAHDSY